MTSNARQSVIRARFETSLFTHSAVVAGAEHFLLTHRLEVEFYEDHAAVALIPHRENTPDVSSDLADAVLREALREALTGGIPSGPAHPAFQTGRPA